MLGAGWIGLTAWGRRAPAVLGALAIAAALSDFFDGRLARRHEDANGYGRWLDGFADIAFILAALGCESWAGAIPAYVPILVSVSFAQYAIDSLLLHGPRPGPAPSLLGHWAGVLNYILVIVLAFAPAPAMPGALVRDCAPLVAVFYLAAMVERAAGYPWRA